MPTFAENTPRRTITLFDVDYTLPNAFAEGHVLTALEADFINQRVASAVASALASSVRRAMEKAKTKDVDAGFAALNLADDDAIQAELDSIFEEYEVGGNNRGSGGPSLSALDKAIRALAVKGVIAWAKKTARKVKDLRETLRDDGVSVFDHLVDGYVEKHRERLTPVAQAQLDAVKAADADAEDMEDMLDGSEASPTASTDGSAVPSAT